MQILLHNSQRLRCSFTVRLWLISSPADVALLQSVRSAGQGPCCVRCHISTFGIELLDRPKHKLAASPPPGLWRLVCFAAALNRHWRDHRAYRRCKSLPLLFSFFQVWPHAARHARVDSRRPIEPIRTMAIQRNCTAPNRSLKANPPIKAAATMPTPAQMA